METEEVDSLSPNPTANIKAETEEAVTAGHTCGVCGRSFPLLSSLSQHMRRHTREKPYKCPYCDHRTAQKGTLKAHIRSHKLGLLSPSISDKDGDPEQKDSTETPERLEILSKSDDIHRVNGKVKKKATKKQVKSTDGLEEGDEVDSLSSTCTICGQVFPEILLLKSHMKRHRSSQDHGCRICGRRFRQAWFLQSHMRIHRVKAQLKGGKNNDPPATINGVPQDPASLINEECLYELCAGCGNFFLDRKTLRIHEKLHKLNHSRTQSTPKEEIQDFDMDAAKRQFLEGLNLTSAGKLETSEEINLGKRIQEMDPVCSYQAWQLATRGRLVEVTEKGLGWEERLADAEVAYNTEKGEYVPLKQEKKRKAIDTSRSNMKKVKVDTGLDQTSNALAQAKGGDKKICQKDRILLNGLGHAFYEALQTKKVNDVPFTSKETSSIRSQGQEDKKTFFCELCDFHTDHASLLRSHLHMQHQHFLDPYSMQSPTTQEEMSDSKPSSYMDYLRSRSVFLSQVFWNPNISSPDPGSAESNIKNEKSNFTVSKEQGQVQKPSDAGSLLNLSSLPTSEGKKKVNYPVKAKGMVRHRCPYCTHTSNYPEVLWIHQRVEHRMETSCAIPPKWAPCSYNTKSFKGGATPWRRTGPPPFLEGKDCPPLLAPKSQRTKPPIFTTQSGSKPFGPDTSSGVPKPMLQPKDTRFSDGRQSSERMGLLTQKNSGERKQAEEGGSKISRNQVFSSSSSVQGKSAPHTHRTCSPKHTGHRAGVEANFPQEGLGFMFARNHGGASSNSAADRHPHHRPSCDSSSSQNGPNLWAATNMWGHNAYLEPLRFAQEKTESTGEIPVDINVLNLLKKNYTPHDLAALYQHWGFVDPRIDPQALLQMNGNFAKEAHSTREAPKQVKSHTTSSSGSAHKGT